MYLLLLLLFFSLALYRALPQIFTSRHEMRENNFSVTKAHFHKVRIFYLIHWNAMKIEFLTKVSSKINLFTKHMNMSWNWIFSFSYFFVFCSGIFRDILIFYFQFRKWNFIKKLGERKRYKAKKTLKIQIWDD